MVVSLSAAAKTFVDEKVRAGQFASAEEAVNGLLSVVQEQERLTPADIEELRAEVDIGIADADDGRFVQFTAEDVIRQGRAALAARKRRRSGRRKKNA